jgi:hypothetical protein
MIGMQLRCDLWCFGPQNSPEETAVHCHEGNEAPVTPGPDAANCPHTFEQTSDVIVAKQVQTHVLPVAGIIEQFRPEDGNADLTVIPFHHVNAPPLLVPLSLRI